MYPNNVNPEEMAMREDLDVIASLNMIGEGGPVPFSLDKEKEQLADSETNVTKRLPLSPISPHSIWGESPSTTPNTFVF